MRDMVYVYRTQATIAFIEYCNIERQNFHLFRMVQDIFFIKHLAPIEATYIIL